MLQCILLLPWGTFGSCVVVDVGVLGIGGGGVAMLQCSWNRDVFGVVMCVNGVVGVLVLRRCACWWPVGGVLGALVFS